jgi:ribosomal protein S25
MAVTFSEEASTKRATFLRILFGDLKGYVCIATIDRRTKDPVFQETFFRIPDQSEQMLSAIDSWAGTHDVYYCPMILTMPKRMKQYIGPCSVIWADLDECHPDFLHVAPSIVVETSPGRFQALWRLKQAAAPADAEQVAMRIAYAHQQDGADISGWDLTQLLRVPFTMNWKYPKAKPDGTPPNIFVVSTDKSTYDLEDFDDAYPPVLAPVEMPLPELGDLPYAGDPEKIINAYRSRLPPQIVVLYATEPETNMWSQSLWKLEMGCFEAGMSVEEVFVVAREASCNKFKRDGRTDMYLWRDVLRAFIRYEQTHRLVTTDDVSQSLLTDEEREAASNDITIVEEYVEWAKTLGDAAWEYHQAGAFVCLSSLIAGPVRLPTSYGTLVPNLWFMILADTTLTRKTTAMDIAMDLVTEIDSDAVLATDGSIEGLFASLAGRPGRPSIFLRDEFSGLLENISRKDYYAGMAEVFTKMYDGKYQKRVLRRETIEVKEPVLIMFAGGIKERVLSLLTYEHIASGFLPRFVFIAAESNVSKLRPLGPPTDETIEKRYDLLRKLAVLHNYYSGQQVVTVNGRSVSSSRKWDARLTPEAWQRYNDFEHRMLDIGLDSFHKELVTPTFDRLAKTGLKMAVLIAASRRRGEEVVVELQDMVKAISFIEKWKVHSAMVVNSVGKTAQEKQIDRIKKAIVDRPGVLRSDIMQFYRLTARDAEIIFRTLEERNQISRVRRGRTEALFAVS